MTKRKSYKQPASDQETLVTQIRTYIYGLQQQLEELRVSTTDECDTLRRAVKLVKDGEKDLVVALEATITDISNEGRRKKAACQRRIKVLERAVEIIQESPGLVRPNQFRLRCAVLESMALSSKPLSSKQIIEYLSLCGLLIDRRRLSISLSY
jgi:hypothetical protein